MAAEVNPRQCIPPGEEKPCSTHKSPRKVKAASGKTRSTEQVDKPVKDEGPRVRTSVLQGKVKALKERRESRTLQDEGREKENHEDALVSPQLRTYLTEDLLECTKHGRYPTTQQSWRWDDLWGTYSSDGPSNTHSNGSKVVKPSNSSQNLENDSSLSHQGQPNTSSNDLAVPEDTTKWDSASLTLAERVERNRLELRTKFGKAADHGGAISHSQALNQGQPIKSWVITSEEDGDIRVEIPEGEDSGELSARHEQAKQLLQRARMKAKGASPLRASHCVLTHPHSQPTLRRGSNLSGAATDGGSLSDSSSSEYSSWHKNSRGSSPSHVRFQDESERDAEERYRERLQVPQKVSTPPPKRQSSGPISYTEQLSPSGHGQCGACGSYVKGTGNGPAATHGTNLRNVHLGSKMTQEGSVSCPLGVRPSPHWILPSQPWRMYTELIRETHIGSDSTPDSSGDDDGNRSKKSRDCVMQRHCRNNSTSAEQGVRISPSNTCLESEIKVGRSHADQSNGHKIGTILENRVKNTSNYLESSDKTSEANQEMGSSASYCVKTGLRKSPQNTEMKPTRKHKNSAEEFVTDQSRYIQDAAIGAVVLDMDIKRGNHRIDFADSRSQVPPVIECTSQVVSPPFTSGHVPVPPSGKAPIMMPSRNRLTLRAGGTSLQPYNSQEGDMVQACHDKNEPQFKPVPNNKKSTQETLGVSDGYQLSTPGITSKEYKSREKTQKLKKHTENRKSKEVKENGDYVKDQEARELDRPYSNCRQKDYNRHPSLKDQRDKDHGLSSLSRAQKKSEIHHSKREEKSEEKSEINGQLTCNNNANTGSGQCSHENIFNCHTRDVGMSSKDRYLEAADDGLLQPAVKKGDLRSGMRKIFSSIGLTSRPKLERFQSSSLEQISCPDHVGRSALAHGDTESSDGSVKPGKIKKSPSLQSLKLMSPFHLPRKSSSVQNLLGKSDRSAVYITGDASPAPRRTLSVEDIGSPGKARVLGKVAQVYPDGTRLLELQRPENGTFGFRISAGNGRPDLGIYVQEMSDADTAKLYSGLLRVGDEVLEVNGTKVSILGKTHLTELMNREPVLSLRVLHQRRTKC